MKNINSPETQYFKTRKDLDIAVGKDFIRQANKVARKEVRFLVGLSHGQSPSGAYQYILDNYHKIKNPHLIRYTFVNSPLQRQRNLKGVLDANSFLQALQAQQHLDPEHILGSNLDRQQMEAFVAEFNKRMAAYLEKCGKDGLDYVFLATNPAGHVGGISRNSAIFSSKEFVGIVHDRREKEITKTPYFLKKSKRIAFLATKADKRRALAWLLSQNGKPNESPSFLRHIRDVKKRMTVFVDDKALNWPQIEVKRNSLYGTSTIRIDMAKPYDENAAKKLPVVLLIHGFLGLNSYDGLLTMMPDDQYIAAAMHYGSVPDALPVEHYSKHIVNNIDAVVEFFGSKGHPVYIFDHSMGNIYFLMINRDFAQLKGIQKYLRGRIGANPFFGIESKHAVLGFMKDVILPALSSSRNFLEKALFLSLKMIIPIATKQEVRKRGIQLTDVLISKDSAMRDRVWKSVRSRILYLMTNLDSLPHLNRIPIERALNRLPAKVFVIQIHSALQESQTFDEQVGLTNITQHNIPVKILKSGRDSIAKFVDRFYNDGVTEVIDITDYTEKDLFREHLFHMVNPEKTVGIISQFIEETLQRQVQATGDVSLISD